MPRSHRARVVILVVSSRGDTQSVQFQSANMRCSSVTPAPLTCTALSLISNFVSSMVSDGSFAWIEHIHNTHTQFSHSHGYHTYAAQYRRYNSTKSACDTAEAAQCWRFEYNSFVFFNQRETWMCLVSHSTRRAQEAKIINNYRLKCALFAYSLALINNNNNNDGRTEPEHRHIALKGHCFRLCSISEKNERRK